MGVFDNVKFFDEPAGPPPEPGLAETFGQGLRSGGYAARGQLHKVAGTVMDAVGLDGSTQNAKAKVDAAYSQAHGQDLTPLGDVHDVSSGLRWAAGTAGQVAPMAGAAVGAGLLTGGGMLPALAAGTLATMPFEMGGQLQRQEQDDANQWATPGQRLGAAAPTAALSSAVQNIVPAGVASRMMGKTAAQSFGRIAARGAADIPAQGAAMAGAEGIRQVGDQALNPAAQFNPEAIKEAGIEGMAVGGLFGAAGAAGHALHSSGSAIKGAPGRAWNAAKGLVPDSIGERAGVAVDAGGDVAAKVADWAKGTIKEKTTDVKAWGKELLGDEAAPDSFKAMVQDAIANPGDTAKATWLAAQKFTRDAAAKVSAAAEEADIPTKLRGLYQGAKDKGTALMNKMADGREVADHEAPDQARAQADADQTTFQKASQWVEELAKENLGPEKTAQLKQAAGDLGNKANQMIVAGLKRGSEMAKDLAEKAKAFNEKVNKNSLAKQVDAAEQRAADTFGIDRKTGRSTVKPDGSIKKSEDYSGARAKVAEAVTSVIGPDHPALQDPATINHLAAGLRRYIEDVASGKALDSFDQLDHLTRLYDVLGEDTTAVLKAVHTAVSGAGKDDKAIFRTLTQMDAIAKGRQGVLDTMQKNLRPELQDSVTMPELQAEMAVVEKWARQDTAHMDDAPQGRRDQGPPTSLRMSPEERQFKSDQIRRALEFRYGPKVDLVLKAVEANAKKEKNVIESVRMKTDEEGNVLGEKNDVPSTSDQEINPEKDTIRSKLFPQNGQLYLHPDVARDSAAPSKFADPATQRMRKAEKENPNATVHFRRASELDQTDPKVKAMIAAKHADIMDGEIADGRSAAEAKKIADKEIENYGLVTAEQSKQETTLSRDELDAVTLNAKKYSDSKARIDTDPGQPGNVIIDAVKLTEAMNKKMAGDRTMSDELGRRNRDARMFMEGVAAVMERTGKVFEIPDETAINKQGMTWGEAKKLDVRTSGDKAYDRASAELDRQRANYPAASPAEKRNLKAMADETLAKRKDRVTQEQTDEPLPREIDNKEAEFKARAARIEEIDEIRDNLDVSKSAGRGMDARLWNESQELQRLQIREGDQTTRREIDPFGPTHDALRGAEEGGGVKINSSGNPRDAEVMGRRMPAKHNPRAGVLPYEGPGRRTNDIGPGEEHPIAKGELGTPTVQAAKAMAKGSAAERALSRKLFGLVDHERLVGMDARDRVALDAIGEIEKASDRAPAINLLAEKYLKGDSGGSTPSPKARAAKQAAFVEKARSGDEATLKAVKESTDPKGLQRAAEHLNGLKDAGGEKVAHMIDAINDRLAELVQIPGVAYGMQTKHYSLQSEVIHAALARGGFAATHDSPNRHEGIFDWRNHAETGEGAMVKGAGTYLSTSDVVHGYYKKMFESKAAYNAKQALKDDPTYKALTSELRALQKTGIVPAEKISAITDKIFAMEDALPRDKSPTYHLSVDIKPEELMNWDKPLSGQSELVQAAALKAMKTHALDDMATTYAGIEPNLNVRGEDFYRELSSKLGGDRQASDYLQSLGILGHRMRAIVKDGEANPNYVIYDDSKIRTNYVHFDQTTAAPGQHMGPQDRKAVETHIDKVLGPNIGVAWADIMHAGEFERTATADIIRLSIHSMNPMSTAYHESLHGLMQRFRDNKQSDIGRVLEKAGESAPVMNQLRKLLANEPAALKQLLDPEERAAYMYQFWAQGKLTLGPQAQTVFQRIAQFIRKVTGLWTNDERAEKIMEYFHSGEMQKNAADPNAVHRALMESGTSRALEKMKAMTEPFREMAATLASAGGARLRDTGIPALRQLADTMKLKTTSEGQDAGFVPVARAEHARMMNQLGTDLHGVAPGAMNEALEAMQTGIKPQSLEARKVALIVHKRLAEALTYMQQAGVKIESLGMKDGVPYFPRSWDASYVSSHQKEFMAMADKYVQAGTWKGDPHTTMRKLMVTDGAEFNVEVDKPGMQHSKERVLSFVSHADAAPFMRKDLYQIMNNYMLQASRRAEWARRFGDDGSGVTMLLERARAQGATPAQLETAQKFIRAVDGTLGDTLNPTARRAMGDMIVYQNIRLLPLGIFSSAVDSQGIIVRGGTVGDSFKAFKRGLTEMVKNFQKDPKSDGMTQLAEAIGTIENATLVHTMGASYSQGMVGDRGRAWNDAFFRLNLMDQYNRSMRVGATEAALGFLVRHSTKPGEHSARFLRELGLDASDVQLDASGRPKLFEHDGLSLEHSAKMLAAMNRWVDGAVLRPDAVDKAVWMSDPRFALVAHLKTFVMAFHETILKRVAHEMANGNYHPAMALASYVPMMLAADYIKGMIQGGGDQPSWKAGWGPSEFLWNATERAGVFGTGQYAIDALADVERGGSGIGALTGPTIEQLTDGLRVLGGRGQFNNFALKSMPANALYAAAMHGDSGPDPKFAD